MVQQKRVRFFFFSILYFAIAFLMMSGMATAADSDSNIWSTTRDNTWHEGNIRRPWGNIPRTQRPGQKDSVRRNPHGLASPGYGPPAYYPYSGPYPYAPYSKPDYGYLQPYQPYGNWNPYSFPGTGSGFPDFGGPGSGFAFPFFGW
ncbi:MAG TPA: hypothetical protein ENI65_07715 [Gammaproteobacteria bacterium]|nr:hypothetical protein [Gammaproteobacteria bacterium]